MSQERTKRKLTAILSADVVGYSRLMEADEAWTIQSLEENKRLIVELVEEYKGRVVDAPGDNVLVEFNSVINAVECAVEMQKKLNKKNSKLMEDHRMNFRIGVNLGDVVEEDGRIYGNGVNIAARLEGLADPGGICISGTAYDQVIRKLDLEYEHLGEHNVKNISEPIRVYRLLMGSETAGNKEVREIGRVTAPAKQQYLWTAWSATTLGLPWVTAAIAITAIIVGLLIWNLKSTTSPKPRQAMYFDYELPVGQRFTNPQRTLVAVSPDGTKIIYVANQQLYVRNFNEPAAKPIQGTDEGPSTPFFSPDGQQVGYYSSTHRQWKKIAVSGGAPVTLCKAGFPYGATWGADGMIVFGAREGIMRVSSNGGTPEILVETDGEQVHGPSVLPGGEWLLFAVAKSSGTPGLSRWDEAKIVVQSLKSGERKVLRSGGSDPRYIPTGYLVYALEDVLYAIAFDADSLETTGGAVPIIEGLRRSVNPNFVGTGSANYGFSDNGMLAFIPGGTTAAFKRSLVWMNRHGNEETLEAPRLTYQHPSLSPDGTQLSLCIETSGNSDIWIWDLVRKTPMRRLTFNETVDDYPLWTPDSRKILFNSDRDGRDGVYWKAADGRGVTERLGSVSANLIIPASWSSDEKALVLEEQTGEGNTSVDIVAMSMEGDHARKPLLQGESTEANPQISPDGRWIAYMSMESGQQEIYVRPYPDVKSGKWQVSTNGGQEPRWSPDGRELFFRDVQLMYAMMVVEVSTEPTFRITGLPRELFRDVYFSEVGHNWDISPDGEHFLMIKDSSGDPSNEEASRPRITIVLNWFEELKQRVPVD